VVIKKGAKKWTKRGSIFDIRLSIIDKKGMAERGDGSLLWNNKAIIINILK